MRLLAVWLINALSLLLLAYLLPAIQVRDFGSAIKVALVLGIINVLIRPVLLLLTLPVNLLSLGLFTFVINGFCLWLASELVSGFHISSFGMAIIGALVYSVISWLATGILLGARE